VVETETDHELMLEVRNGNVNQLSLLFERHNKHLFNFFLRSGNDRQSSEDLVQEVFLRILNSRHTYKSNGTFIPWMFTIARNVHIDHYRKYGGKANFPEEFTYDDSTGPTPEATTSYQGDVAILQQALAQLPPDKREVLILSRFQDLRYKEISKILECSVNAVKVRVFRALQELRDNFYEITGETKHGL